MSADICNTCRQQFYFFANPITVYKSTDIVSTVPAPVPKFKKVLHLYYNKLSICYIARKDQITSVCNIRCSSTKRFKVVSGSSRRQNFKNRDRERWKQIEGNNIRFNASDIIWLLDRLRVMVSHEKIRLHFNGQIVWIYCEQDRNHQGKFKFLVSIVFKLKKKSANRSPTTAISILLVKLTTGLSHRWAFCLCFLLKGGGFISPHMLLALWDTKLTFFS